MQGGRSCRLQVRGINSLACLHWCYRQWLRSAFDAQTACEQIIWAYNHPYNLTTSKCSVVWKRKAHASTCPCFNLRVWQTAQMHTGGGYAAPAVHVHHVSCHFRVLNIFRPDHNTNVNRCRWHYTLRFSRQELRTFRSLLSQVSNAAVCRWQARSIAQAVSEWPRQASLRQLRASFSASDHASKAHNSLSSADLHCVSTTAEDLCDMLAI